MGESPVPNNLIAAATEFLLNKIGTIEKTTAVDILVIKTACSRTSEDTKGPLDMALTLSLRGYLPQRQPLLAWDALLRGVDPLPKNPEDLLELVDPALAPREYRPQLRLGGPDYYDLVPTVHFKNAPKGGVTHMQPFEWDPANGLVGAEEEVSEGIRTSPCIPIARINSDKISPGNVQTLVERWWQALLEALASVGPCEGANPKRPTPIVGIVALLENEPLLLRRDHLTPDSHGYTVLCAQVSYLGRIFHPRPEWAKEKNEILKKYGAHV